MAITHAKSDAVCEQLLKHAQQVARVCAEAAPVVSPRHVQVSTTEVSRLQARLKAAEDALSADLVELARRAVENAKTRRQSLTEQLDALKAERRDMNMRREELARCAAGYDWPIVHRERRDFLGPLTVDHTPEAASLWIGRCKLVTLQFPSGAEVLEAIKGERGKLESSARTLWPEMRDRLLALQTAPSAGVPWPTIVKALTPEGGSFRRREPAVLLVLAMLREGRMEGRWIASFAAPTLAKQNRKDAVSVPRIDKPGNPDRVAAIRLEQLEPAQ